MRSRSASRRSFRPVVEALEGRALLSVCTVDRLTDLGEGQGMMGDLRYCITQAQNGDSIRFSVTGTVNLTQVLPNLTRSISIEGPGANLLTIDGNRRGSVFWISPVADIRITALTISRGRAVTSQCDDDDARGGGGGILNEGTLFISEATISENEVINSFYRANGGGICNFARLTIHNSTIRDNVVNGRATYGAGGGIFNRGTLEIINTTVSANLTFGEQGGIGAGIHNEGGLTVINGTVTGNSARGGSVSNHDAYGGGIYNGGTAFVSNSTIHGNVAGRVDYARGGGVCNDGFLVITNSTVTQNDAQGSQSELGGGIGQISGRVYVLNTIVASNRANSSPDLYGALTSSGYNLIGDTTGGSGFVATDLLNVNPLLGPLQDNGGPTQTHALLPGSPAIDRGDSSHFPDGWDQRGPGYDRLAGTSMDIGAFEVQGGGGGPGGNPLDGVGEYAVSWKRRLPEVGKGQTMALTIRLPRETEEKLLQRAAERGQDVTEYIRGLVEADEPDRNGIPGTPGDAKTFDEILGPIRKGWEESGLTDEEVDQLFEEALQDVRQARRKGGPA